jgi:L,D-peptidoglycan transpeptidase YkuD (ErfK/YbiS/YcfS/YnhG family)
MIIVNKSRYLYFKNFKFRCAIGISGIKRKIKEGDGITPKGIFKLTKVFYRADKIKKIKTSLKKIKIKKNMGWCNDSNSKYYNKQIKLPTDFHHEKLYRKDRLYDLIIVLDYNMNPIVKNEGSAIFIHIAKKKFTSTKGCIAMNKDDLLFLLSKLKKNTKIKIH